MKKFEVGKEYAMSSPCMHDCVWMFRLVKRTACMVTLEDVRNGDLHNCRINKKVSEWCKAETVYPLGRYSMCPVLSADSEVSA